MGLYNFFFLFVFQFNICGAVPACGTVAGKPALGCEAGTHIEDIKDLRPERPVGMEKSLQLSAEGFLTLTYKGSSPSDRGEPRVTWTCTYFPSFYLAPPILQRQVLIALL